MEGLTILSEKRLACSQVKVALYDAADATPSSFISSFIGVNGNENDIADVIMPSFLAARRDGNTRMG